MDGTGNGSTQAETAERVESDGGEMGTRVREAGTDREPPVEPEQPVEETVARGESGATPFFLLGSVAAAIWTVAAAVAGGVLLLWWLL
jgi:hypothetical protein